MDFLGIGPLELLLILFVLLVAFGPSKLPEIAGTIGRGIRKFKAASTALSREIQDELNETKKEAGVTTSPAAEVRKVLREAVSDVEDTGKEVRSDVSPVADLGKDFEQLAGEVKEAGKDFGTTLSSAMETSSDESPANDADGV